jgi:hypothetical protein
LPESGPLKQLGLHFLSPTRVEAQGQIAREPHFPLLARAIVRRLRTLSQVHGEGDLLKSEYEPLLNLADQVQLAHNETVWLNVAQPGQPHKKPLEGFVGQAWYVSSTDLRPLLPMLWLGQWVQVGKETVWEGGRYKVLARLNKE